jgi:hypothetical protein
MEEGAGWAVVDGRSCSGLASYTKPDTGRLVRKEVTLYGIWCGGHGRQTQKRGRPKRASTQQIAILVEGSCHHSSHLRYYCSIPSGIRWHNNCLVRTVGTNLIWEHMRLERQGANRIEMPQKQVEARKSVTACSDWLF